jgi:hypothetical protein
LEEVVGPQEGTPGIVGAHIALVRRGPQRNAASLDGAVPHRPINGA